jgi:hypothetical protein
VGKEEVSMWREPRDFLMEDMVELVKRGFRAAVHVVRGSLLTARARSRSSERVSYKIR